ncbi:MAG TPA: zf-HC2 domain-containing protein [Pseudonocardia sp.]|jgi:predicted anti-sigma-YlaC factor YlaD|uniref:zf-HC2 domain-containing protein n=1 Tax=Pseudonocardia sp. TaxID=60912 RepID=UPI002ED8C0E1
MRWTDRWSRRKPDPPSWRPPEDDDCVAARAVLSAQLDGEPEPPPTEQTDQHLAHCRYCAVWRESLHRATRRVRLTLARALPDRTPQLLAAVLADQSVRRRTRPAYRLARLGLAAAAAAQLVIVIPALILGDAGALIPPQASRELGAFNAALAVGYLAVALRPARARGALLLVAPATALLVVLAIIGSALGQTTLLAETPHLIAVAGWALLAVLARGFRQELPGRGSRPGRATAS